VGEPHGVEERAFAARFWSLVADPVGAADDVQAIVMHAVQSILRLERGSGSEAPGQLVAELYTVLRDDRSDRYAPPELLAGDPITQRSLVYAIGLLLFERITGTHPFGGTANHDGAVEPDYVLLPSALVTPIRRALSTRPDERYGNLAMMRLRLEEFVRGHVSEDHTVQGLPPPPSLPEATDDAEEAPSRSVISDFAAPAARLARPEAGELAHGAEMPSVPDPAKSVEGDPRDRKPDAPPPPTTRERPEVDVAMMDSVFKVVVDSIPFAPAPPMLANARPAAAPPTAVRHTQGRPSEPYRERPPAAARYRPWLWALAGGIVAGTAVFALTGLSKTWKRASTEDDATPRPASSRRTSPTPSATAPIDRPPEGVPPAAKSVPSEPVPPAAVPPEAAGTPPASAPSIEAQPSALPFDPHAAGQRIAERARGCFSASQLAQEVRFGFSVVYGLDGLAKKVWLPSRSEMLEEEEACIVRIAAEASAGGPPPAVTIVGYGVKLLESRSDVWIRSRR
jgi:hypothetical protein